MIYDWYFANSELDGMIPTIVWIALLDEGIMMIVGIVLGLCAAFFQSCSYLGSRWFVDRYPGGTVRLLALSHILMGGVSIILAMSFWPKDLPAIDVYGMSLLGTVAFYLLGQLCLFMALRHADASRVSPLLGLKVLILALLSAGFLDVQYEAMQWFAVGLSVLAGIILARSGGTIDRQSLLWAIAACLPYCLSDMNIKLLVGHFESAGLLRSTVFATAITYIVCGIAGLAICPILPDKGGWRSWRDAVPFAAAWLISMLFLYACFSEIGVVFGNILQSTRGIQSIVMGAVIAHIGMISLEKKVRSGILIQRISAAILMSGAIAMFYLSSK